MFAKMMSNDGGRKEFPPCLGCGKHGHPGWKCRQMDTAQVAGHLLIHNQGKKNAEANKKAVNDLLTQIGADPAFFKRNQPLPGDRRYAVTCSKASCLATAGATLVPRKKLPNSVCLLVVSANG